MISVRDLVKVYPGPVTALAGIDIAIPTGMFGLLGPNGAGKSTLMRILAGLLQPTAGTVIVDGRDIVAHPELVWAQLGYLPQEFGFYPHLTGEEMLRHILRLKGVEGGCDELLERVGLRDVARRRIVGYSGGMKQRLGIAQAVAGNPRLLIVDEPTAGLDPEERQRFYHLLAELAADRTVVLSTHIVDDVAVLCPRFAIIRGGRLLAVTSPREARAAIAGSMFEGEVARDSLEELHRGYRVTRTLLIEGRPRVRVYAPGGGGPSGFVAVEATLEDAYLVMMREPAAERGAGTEA